MIGFEYILQLHNVSLTELSKELGMARTNFYNWIDGKRKIPDKYIEILSNKFKIPEEYFQKELDDIDKLQIQKIKLNNEITFIEEVGTYDPEEINEICKLDSEIEKKRLMARIEASFEKSNIDKVEMIWAYNKLATLFISNKVKDESLIRKVLSALTTYFGIGWAGGEITTALVNYFKKVEKHKKDHKSEEQ